MSLVEKPRNKRDFSTTLREIKANRRAATEPVVRSSQIPRFVRHPRRPARASAPRPPAPPISESRSNASSRSGSLVAASVASQNCC